jgi:hypothetical protein
MTKKKKATKESARTTLASVTKEMAQPRFAESARKDPERRRGEPSRHRTADKPRKSVVPLLLTAFFSL